MEKPVIWKQIITNGNPDLKTWLESFSIAYSDDGIDFIETEGEYISNYEPKTVVKVEILKPFISKFIRVKLHNVQGFSMNSKPNKTRKKSSKKLKSHLKNLHPKQVWKQKLIQIDCQFSETDYEISTLKNLRKLGKLKDRMISLL